MEARKVALVTAAGAGIPLVAAGFVFYIVNVTVIGYFQSVERVCPATIYSLARGLVFLVPSFLIMPHVAGTPGIWLALPVSEALTFILIAATRIIKRKMR